MLEVYSDILSVEEVCEALRIGANQAYDLLNSGKVKGYKQGRVWRIPKQALVEYIVERSKIKL
jgi:excisionase family DNA binding protein